MLSALSLVVVALTQASNAPDDGLVVSSHAFGKIYTTRVDRKAVDKTPMWGDAEENPPISARQAIKLADKTLRSIAKAPNGWKWEVTNLGLGIRGTGHRPPLWLVTYAAVPVDLDPVGVFADFDLADPDPDSEIPELAAIHIMVMMDGTVIKPVVTDEEQGSDATPSEKKPAD